MRAWVKPIIIGTLIEAVLFTAMNMAPSGPCGPETRLGALLILLHIPSAVVLMPVAWMLPDERWFTPLWFISSTLLWVLLIRGFLAMRKELSP